MVKFYHRCDHSNQKAMVIVNDHFTAAYSLETRYFWGKKYEYSIALSVK